MSSSYSNVDTHMLLENALGRPTGAHDSRLRKVHWRPREVVLGVAVLLAWRLLLLCNPTWTASLSPTLAFFVTAGFPALWMVLYPVIVARHRGIRNLFSEITLKHLAKESLFTLPVALAALAAMAVISYIRVQLGSEPLGTPQVTAARSDVFALMLLSVLIAPLAEELFFRGFIYNCFRRSSPLWVAIAVQAGMFAIMHPYTLERVVAVFLLGLALGVVYEWRKTLVAPIIIHTTINLFAAAATALVLLVQLSTPYLGVVGDVTEQGYVIRELAAGGPAEAAGLLPGDVITELDGAAPEADDSISARLAFREPGETLPVRVRRGDRVLELSITLAERPRE